MPGWSEEGLRSYQGVASPVRSFVRSGHCYTFKRRTRSASPPPPTSSVSFLCEEEEEEEERLLLRASELGVVVKRTEADRPRVTEEFHHRPCKWVSKRVTPPCQKRVQIATTCQRRDCTLRTDGEGFIATALQGDNVGLTVHREHLHEHNTL